MNVEKLMKMAGAVRTGGKGSMRRLSNYFNLLTLVSTELVTNQCNYCSSGPDNLENLKRLAEHLQKQVPGTGGAVAKQDNDNDDDDDVPELVPGETFEAAADENQAS
ncbi:hypothetical protein BHE74_00016568 [Ensete ventricosum]|nr:hypothetical protein BHE74_00016568 [Ensete ventricosum]